MANQILARLGVVMTLNVAEWEEQVNKAIAANNKLKRDIKQQNEQAAKEIQKLHYAILDYGREVSNVEKIEREFTKGGKYTQVTEEGKKHWRDMAKAMDDKVVAEKKAQKETIKTGTLSAYQLQALSYQTTDIVTSLAGGQSPLLVLIQQGGQLKDQFGGVGGVFRAFASVLSVTKVVVGTTAVALGLLAYAAFKGSEEFKQFNNSLILSGNTAGLTYDKFKALSKELSAGGMVGLKDAKNIFASLASSGQFTSKSIESVAKSISLVSRLSGQSVDIVGKELISAFNGTASSAKNLNEKYNFLTLAQYRQIEAMERAGDKQGAIIKLSNAFNESAEKQAPKLGTLVKLWNSLSDIWEKIKGIGAPKVELPELWRELARREDALANAQDSAWSYAMGTEPLYQEQYDIALAAIKKYYKDLEEVEKEAERKEDERRKIAIATPLEALIEKDYQLKKTLNEGLYQQRLAHANGLARIEEEASKKSEDAKLEYQKKNEKEKSQNILRNENQLVAELNNIELERQQKRNAMEFAAQRAIDEKISSVWIEVDANRELLDLFGRQKVVTQDDIEQIKVRAKLAEEIAKVMADPAISDEQKRISAELLTQAYAQKEQLDGKVKLAQKANETEKTLRAAQKTQSDSIELEKTKLELFSKNILLTESERDIALSRLETEQKIAAIRQQIVDNPQLKERGEEFIVNQNVIQQRREEVIGLAERLQVLGDVNQAVFSSMENAITNFVKTGKLSFKDLARSLIQDILAIYMKAQMLQMMKGIGGLFSGGGGGGAALTAGGTPMVGGFGGGPSYAADGGYISGPTVVGENGPELFIPRTAGTIVPNQQMAGMTGSPQVVYNGPYIANMQAIDTQSAAQFLARNKESVWAANQSASRSVPQSR